MVHDDVAICNGIFDLIRTLGDKRLASRLETAFAIQTAHMRQNARVERGEESDGSRRSVDSEQ